MSMGQRHRFVIAALPCLVLLGCAAAGSDPAARPTNTVPLVTTMFDGVADSQVVPIRFAERDAWLALDTGAPFTFLFSDPAGPEYVEDAATIAIGCESWQLPAYRDDAIGVEDFQGKPIVGILGLDFFLDVPAEIDYPGGRLVRHLDGNLPAGAAALPRVPLRGRDSARALIDIVVDGTERTLMFDTGAHDTILIDAAVSGEAGDSGRLIHLQTADGRTFPARAGSAILSLPGESPRTIPVMRAAELPYMAAELRELDAGGLLGLTAFGWRRIVFDFDGGALRLGPRRKEPRCITQRPCSTSTNAPTATCGRCWPTAAR